MALALEMLQLAAEVPQRRQLQRACTRLQQLRARGIQSQQTRALQKRDQRATAWKTAAQRVLELVKRVTQRSKLQTSHTQAKLWGVSGPWAQNTRALQQRGCQAAAGGVIAHVPLELKEKRRQRSEPRKR